MFDLRAGSATEHRKAELRIDGDGSPLGLYIPPAVAHGFYAETDVVLQYRDLSNPRLGELESLMGSRTPG